MKKGKNEQKVRLRRWQPFRTVLPLVAILGVGSLGAYLTFRSHGAVVTPTFKLVAEGWRGLGSPDNDANLRHFKRIIAGQSANPNAIRSKAGADAKIYVYTLGPYTSPPQLPRSLADPANPYYGASGTRAISPNAYLIGVNSKKYAPYGVEYDNNYLLNPESSEARTFAANEAEEKVKLNGASNQFDGVFSDSMGLAPIQTNYLKEKPMYPGTTAQWTDATRWITGQAGFLAAKRAKMNSMGKSLIMNGLANGGVYWKTPVSASPKALLAGVDGGMAERIFRDPNKQTTDWDSFTEWKQDVDMIADVESQGKEGYWWTKCWSVNNTCTKETGAYGPRIDQVRRHAIASFLLGAGSKSYFSFDTNRGDNNAAEWFANDYTKAQTVGVQTGTYSKDAGGIYKRGFTNGLVVVNPMTGPLTINLGSTSYKDFTDTTRTGSYTVPANTGNVLIKTSSPPPGDTTPPTISRTAPANGATISGTLTVTGTANDNTAVTKVELLVDGAVKGSDSSPPAISIAIDSRTLGNGTHTIILKAYDAAGNAAQTSAISITVSNGTAPPAPTITNFTANPNPVTAGGRVWLSWSTTGTTTCSINPDGVRNTPSFTWQTPALTTIGTKNYTLNCINSANTHVTKPIAITVKAPTTPPSKPVVTASKTSVTPGQSTTISWTSTGATSCTLNPGNITTTGPTGSRVVSPSSTTAYTVTCRNGAGTVASDPLTITVSSNPEPPAAPVIVSFTANPANIESGQQSTLSWSSSNVRPGGCRLVPSPLSSTDPNGVWVTPSLSASTSYTLSCVNSAGTATNRSVSVTVNNTPAPPAPEPEDPESDDEEWWDDEYLTYDDEDSEETYEIDNGSVDEDLSGLAVLDPSNVTDEEKLEDIDHVEYYIGEDLIQSDDTKPFALDTRLLKNGTYTITEKTYYIDGSTSEVTRTVDIQNKPAASGSKKEGASGVKLGVGLGLSLLILALLVGGYLYIRKRHLIPALETGKFFAGLPHRRSKHDTPKEQTFTSASLASSLGAGTVFTPTHSASEKMVTPPSQTFPTHAANDKTQPASNYSATPYASPDHLPATPAAQNDTQTKVGQNISQQTPQDSPAVSSTASGYVTPVPETDRSTPIETARADQSPLASSSAGVTPLSRQASAQNTQSQNPNHLEVPKEPQDHDPISPNWG